jgi:hypothetical protein
MAFESFPGRAEPLGKQSNKVSDVFTVVEASITYRIILCLNAKERNPDSEHGIGGSSITVIGSLGGVAPGRALQSSVPC